MGLYGAPELVAEQDVERRREVAANGRVAFDVKPLEEDLVEEPPHEWRSGSVRRLAVAGEIQGALQVRGNQRPMVLGHADPAIDVGQLTRYARLLALEQIERDRAGVVSVEKFRSLVEQAAALASESSCFGTSLFVVGVEVVAQLALDRVPQLVRQADGGVVLFDELFDPRDGDSPHRAAGPLLVLADTGEVGVSATAPAERVRDDHAAAAVAAE